MQAGINKGHQHPSHGQGHNGRGQRQGISPSLLHPRTSQGTNKTAVCVNSKKAEGRTW